MRPRAGGDLPFCRNGRSWSRWPGAGTTRFRRSEWAFLAGDLVLLSLFAFLAWGRFGLQGIADGKTYAQIDDRGARQAVEDAEAAGASEAEIADLQATADQLTAQRDSLFRGETLRGLLLSAFAWSTIGRIAGIAAAVAFAAALVMTVLVIAGAEHLRRHRPTTPTTPATA